MLTLWRQALQHQRSTSHRPLGPQVQRQWVQLHLTAPPAVLLCFGILLFCINIVVVAPSRPSVDWKISFFLVKFAKLQQHTQSKEKRKYMNQKVWHYCCDVSPTYSNRMCVMPLVLFHRLISSSPCTRLVAPLTVLMKDRCKLFCRVAGTTAYYQLKDRVIDGTPCGPDTFDICVQGLCRVGEQKHVSNFYISS